MSSIFSKLRHRSDQTPPPAVSVEHCLVEAGAAYAAHDFAAAIPLYDQALRADPSNAEAHYKRANALKNVGRLEAALAGYDHAIARKPDHAHAFCNRGVVAAALGHRALALSSYDAALALDPRDAVAHYNRALLLQDDARWDDARAAYDAAVRHDPEFADAQYNRALTLLFMGDFEAGWRGYEWRWKNAERLAIGKPRHANLPPWRGEESLAGKRLLLHSEAGLGDTLQFCRYVYPAVAAGATVYLEVQPPLTALLARLPGVTAVTTVGDPPPEVDCQCPLMSLPLAFRTTLDDIPSFNRYIESDPEVVDRWRSRLGKPDRPRIGLAWSGNPANPIDQRRSIALADWIHYLPEEFEYVCLQRDIRATDRAVLDAHPAPHIVEFAGDSLDFIHTAALCELLDVIITVDTSIAHLSGALGRPTWLMLPSIPDWRWMRDREDSPWYPSLKLYRQAIAGDWRGVFARIAADLAREFG